VNDYQLTLIPYLRLNSVAERHVVVDGGTVVSVVRLALGARLGKDIGLGQLQLAVAK
jgi:hypothetical protein